MTAPVTQFRAGPQTVLADAIAGLVPVLTDGHVTLRAPRVTDFAGYAELMTSARARHVGGPMDAEAAWYDFANYCAGWMLHGHGLWVIDAGGSETLGFVLIGFEWDDPEPELGVLMRAAGEGRGIARAAMVLARDYAFDQLGWDSVPSYVDAGNARSITLMTALAAVRDSHAEAALGDGTRVYRHRKGGA